MACSAPGCWAGGQGAHHFFIEPRSPSANFVSQPLMNGRGIDSCVDKAIQSRQADQRDHARGAPFACFRPVGKSKINLPTL